MCEYEYEIGGKCHREALEGSEKGYCLLHEDWEKKDEEKTRDQFYKEIEEGETNFEGCVLPGFDLSEKEIKGDPNFVNVKVKDHVQFNDAIANGDTNFDNANMDGNISFARAIIKGDAFFRNMIVIGTVSLKRATIKRDVLFNRSIVETNISFKGGIFPFIYWLCKGVTLGDGETIVTSLGKCYYFSIVTATTLGYGGYQPKPGLFHSLASIEAIFGTLMWAAFIAIFARKYMR